MVAQRRFLPLVAVLAAGLVVIVLRLFQVQVVEAAVWGREAANLTRSSNIVPYHRGKITDREGRVLARDEDVYEIVFVYREFRRGYALAQIAHARSALELRAVPLAEALARLDEWARELVSITPAQLAAFARGDAVELGGVHVPASADPVLEQRARRAADVRWYIGALFDLEARDWKRLQLDADDPARERSLVELVASRARETTVEKLRAELARKLASSHAALEALAEQFGGELAGVDAAGSPLDRLVAALERQRRAAEDASADELFERVAGFGAGRIASASLVRWFDLRWIAALVRWDADRTRAWALSRRARYEALLENVIVPRIVARAAVEEDQGRKRASARMLDSLAQLYAPRAEHPRRRGDPPPSWTELTDLAVLAELPTLFEGVSPPRDFPSSSAVLPLNDPELQASAGADEGDPWILVGMATELARAHDLDPAAPVNAAEASARWNEIACKGLPAEDAEAAAELVRLVRAFEAQLGAAVDRDLAILAAEVARPDADERMSFARVRTDAALQEEKSLQKEEQSRPMLLRDDPPYELVHLLERHQAEFRGFQVREATRRRVVELDASGVPVARTLIGGVRKPSLPELFAQVRDERRYDTLKYQTLRSAAEEDELKGLAARLFRADEWTGGAGIEDYFDPELRGRFGWRELQGLANRRALAIGEPPIDGKDLELTLDLDVQKAAQEVLEHPRLPEHDDKVDALWFANPVGAIVLLSTDGEVIAAASVPSTPGERTPGRDREREFVRERTLQMPTFNPPGSVFKPFVAAYALDRIHYDPSSEFTCEPVTPGGTGFYADLHCAGVHHHCNLQRALTVSCNVYFAHVGECFTNDELADMTRLFGFGQPTGVRMFGTEGRGGLVEHSRLKWNKAVLAALDGMSGKRRFANGLTYVEATPMQVARAMAGIATGRLPELTLVRSIGGEPVAPRGRELGIGETSLAFVRHAMELVVTDGEGSAHNKGLDAEKLGFHLAAKTGSGDYAQFERGEAASASDRADAEENRVRKHTWVAGFFPAEKPRAVVVVYLHDTSRTSSHTAVYVTAQFLQTEAVKNWLARTLEADRKRSEEAR